MILRMVLTTLELAVRTLALRKEHKAAALKAAELEHKAKHRAQTRATWTVYLRRFWNGEIQTHRAWADMGTSVWELVSTDIALKYGKYATA